MFGILRPCRHRLPGDLAKTWLAHLCGMCLALRDDHGHLARTVTNYDGLAISALVEAQVPEAARRTAGPCALRGMRPASIAAGAGAQLAGAVSLVLASAKIRDHVADGDGVLAKPGVSGAARRVAQRWARQGGATGERIGFSTAVLLDAVDRQGEVESVVGAGTSVLTATEPTETATAAAFAHTARLAGRPDNEGPLAEAGRLFGRVAHLIDAVEDLADDTATGAWNPLTATGTTLLEARRLCDEAVMGVRLALAVADFRDSKLVHALLVHELGVAVDRAFRPHGISAHQPPHGPGHPGHGSPGPAGWQRPGPPLPMYGQPLPGQPYGHQPPLGATGPQGPQGPPPPPPHDKHGGKPSSCLCWQWPKLRTPPQGRGVFLGCAACLYECGTCQVCCRDPYPGAWSGQPQDAWCGGCGDCCCDPGCSGCDDCCCDCSC